MDESASHGLIDMAVHVLLIVNDYRCLFFDCLLNDRGFVSFRDLHDHDTLQLH